MYKLVSFDMDGTLTYGTTCLQYYVKKLHKENKAIELETLYKTHIIDDYEIADRYALLFKGVRLSQLNEWTDEIPRMKNIKEAVKKLKAANLSVGITSVGPLFANEYFKNKFNFDFTCGSIHEFIDGIHTGRMVHTLAGKDKTDILKGICYKQGIKLDEVIAIGDSRSDIPIFEISGMKIALMFQQLLYLS